MRRGKAMILVPGAGRTPPASGRVMVPYNLRQPTTCVLRPAVGACGPVSPAVILTFWLRLNVTPAAPLRWNGEI